MDLQLQIKMNSGLFVKDPEQSDLGRKIIRSSIDMICNIGFESFTFRKLANETNTTEASIYRYFENKHRLLTYITSWFWTWMEYQLVFYTNNMTEPTKKIDVILQLLTFQLDDRFISEHIDKEKLHHIIVSEGNKSYLTKHVEEDNKAKIFKPYKDLCHRMAMIFKEYDSEYSYPHSLSSTLIETAHHQVYFQEHLPSLTDFANEKGTDGLRTFLKDIIFKTLTCHNNTQ